MNRYISVIQNTQTPYGTAALWWLGQMGLIVKAGNTVVCIDYYASSGEKRQTPVPIPVGEMENIDAFLGSHDHLDHIDHEAWKIWAKTNTKAKFVYPEMHRDKIMVDGISAGSAIGLNDVESVQIGDITITAIAASHEFLDQDPETGLYPCLQYIISGNGVRIYHAGDTVRYEGMLTKIKSFGRIDAALLPINGRDAKRYRRGCIGNMTYQEAADLAGEAGIRMVIPGHWDMFADNSADPEEFADYLDAKYQGEIICMIHGVMEKISVRAEKIH